MDILPWIHASKPNKKGLAPLYIRVTVNRTKKEISTGKQVDPALWDNVKKVVTGRSANADIINKYLTWAQNKLNTIELGLQQNETPYNAEIICNMFNGTHVQRYGLLQVLDMHNELFSQKLGQKGFSPDTLKKYVGLKVKIEYFMQQKYNRKEMFISELNYDWIESFWHFLTTKGKMVRGKFMEPMDPESACGIITKVKKIGKMGFRKQAIAINPWDEFKCSFDKESKEPLTMDQINAILNKEFKIARLDRVRDRFVVGIFTGMANEDIQTATRDMITKDIDRQQWINRGRTKTGELCIIPVWKPVADIIEKYKEDPELIAKGRIFPQLSMQKMNAYLIEIADLCGIDRKLTTHIARHSFADMYLNSGGTIDNLARILGHTNTRTTSGYAKRNKATISTEANTVKDKIFAYLDQVPERRIG